jgi:hypothetical protein
MGGSRRRMWTLPHDRTRQQAVEDRWAVKAILGFSF